MKMKDYSHYKYSQFADDPDFIRWVLKPDQEAEEYWNQVMNRFPEKEKDIKQARKIIIGFQPIEDSISHSQLVQTWDKINPHKQTGKKRTIRFIYAAASIAAVFVLAISGIWYINHTSPDIEWKSASMNEGKSMLITGNDSIIEFDQELVTLDYRKKEEITINSDSTLDFKESPQQNTPNEIIVPRGKRMQVILSDGSKVRINSGTHFIFPANFNKKNREVYLYGQAYFEVSKDKQHPFQVHTPSQTIEVLGTSFNVNAYGDESIEETVLVEGSIKLSTNHLWSKSTILSPGEKGTINKTDQSVSVSVVDVNNYISWINGYLLFRNENIVSVIRQVSRYYNIAIEMPKNIEHISFSGKLDMDCGIEDVMKRISKASSIRYFYKDEKIILKP